MTPADLSKAEVEQEDGPASLPPGENPSRQLSSGQCFKPASESFHIIWALGWVGLCEPFKSQSSIHYNTLLSWV